jgi:hypothetical protein
MSRDGRRFGAAQVVEPDDAGPRNGETYGSLLSAYGVRAVRVFTDRPMRRITVLWLTDRGSRRPPAVHAASVTQPAIVLRSGWGADESLRYDASAKEVWPPAFYPVQKLIVHHTATQNGDPDPAATMRSMYYYHAVTQAWGDIGYNFVIDEQGRIYEGRHTFDQPSLSPPGENGTGYGVTAAHAVGYNSGTVGIALLGTLTDRDATPAARDALERLLAWEADRHKIDPRGASQYTNPVNATKATFANIAGHRDVGATECPGGVFYATLPAIRSDVAAMLGAPPPPPPPAPDFTLSASPSSRSIRPGNSTTYIVTLARTGGFSSAVALAATGLPSGATASFSPNNTTGSSSTLTVRTAKSVAATSSRMTITGTSGTLSRSTAVTLQFTPAGPPCGSSGCRQ